MENPNSLKHQARREKEAKAEAERKRAEYLLAVSKVMKTAEGKTVLMALLRRTHVWAPSFVTENATLTAFREGERNIGLMLMDDMNEAEPGIFSAYLGETLNRSRNND